MSKTLVVSDNEILNQLYVINLEVYLATEVVLVLSTQKAVDMIKEGEKFDLIITMNMINGHDSAAILHEFLDDNNIEIPLVVVGSPSKEIPNIVIVSSSYNLQNLLRSCAQILGVTAKTMAELEVPEYFSVSTQFLIRLEKAPCSIYMQMKRGAEETNFTMIAKKGSELSKVLKKFSDEGIETLFVNRLDRLLVINQISKALCDFIKSTEDMGIGDKSVALAAGFEFVANDFCQSPEAAAEVMNIATACTKVMEEIAKEAPGLRSLLQLLNSQKDGYIYTHSILTSFVANHIVRRVSWGGESHIEKINFVLFFHDIMLAPIYLKHPALKYEEDLLFNDELTEKEKEVVLNHARLAAEMMMTYKRSPMGADLLVKQHHGMTNGIGFAIEFKDDISPLSKIVLIAEAFVEEYMKGKESDPSYQIDLKKMIPLLGEKFRKSTYKKIIETLETLSL
ncbi:MAG: hypothetical protein ACXVLQ_01665 [Bacteriovorax sp.]